jgi:hypothetical protein
VNLEEEGAMIRHHKIWTTPMILMIMLSAFLDFGIAHAEAVKPSGLKGVVLEKNSSIGLPAVKVILSNAKGEYTAITGAGGTFNMTVPFGSYIVEVVHPGYQDFSVPITINNGQFKEVRWSLQREVHLDLGWYSGTGPAERDQYKTFSEDVNTVFLYTNDWECKNADSQEALKAMPDRIGVWLSLPYLFHIEAYHDCRTGGSFAVTPDSLCGFTFNKKPKENTREYCANTYLKPLADGLARIRSFDGANQIRGWYVFDEPYYSYRPYRDTGWNAGIIKEVSDFVRKNDPNEKPIVGVINDGFDDDVKLGSLQDWVTIPDFLGYDYYPKLSQTTPCENSEPFTPLDSYKRTRDWMNTLAKNKGGASSYYVAQGQGCKWNTPPDNFGLATPTLQEIRWYAWTGILRGLGGIIYWWYPRADEDIGRDGNSIRTSVHQVFREINDLDTMSILYRGQASQSYQHDAQPGTLDIAYRYYNGHWYLFVVNAPDQDRRVKFTLSTSPTSQYRMATELIDNYQIQLKQLTGRVILSDYLSKGEVRIYRLFDPPAKSGENFGFEKGLQYWESYGDGTTYEAVTGGTEGSHSAKISREKDTKRYFGLAQRNIPCKQNTMYQLTLQVKTESGNTGSAAASLGSWDSSTTHMDFGWTGKGIDWTQISGTWNSGVKDRLDVVLYGTTDFSGTAYFDGIVLRELGPSAK